MLSAVKMLIMWPAVWLIKLSAWARERVTDALFQRNAMTRAEYERHRREVRELRNSAARLLVRRE